MVWLIKISLRLYESIAVLIENLFSKGKMKQDGSKVHRCFLVIWFFAFFGNLVIADYLYFMGFPAAPCCRCVVLYTALVILWKIVKRFICILAKKDMVQYISLLVKFWWKLAIFKKCLSNSRLILRTLKTAKLKMKSGCKIRHFELILVKKSW